MPEARWTIALTSAAVVVIAVALPWWAMGTDSPVVAYFASRKADFGLAFGQAKYIGALWMAYLARQYPDRRLITVSPGNTNGTRPPTAFPVRCA